MPNWCYNRLEVFGGDEEGYSRKDFFSAIDLEKPNPTPLEIYLPMSDYHKTMEGYNNGGYSWCLETWGTKWAESDFTIESIDDISSRFTFESPWGPPIEGYQKISKIYPSLYFVHDWQEDGMCFAGVAIYHHGHIVFQKETNHEDWPEWLEEYENDDSEYCEKVYQMHYSLTEAAAKALKDLMHIE